VIPSSNGCMLDHGGAEDGCADPAVLVVPVHLPRTCVILAKYLREFEKHSAQLSVPFCKMGVWREMFTLRVVLRMSCTVMF
jgi:hypothetical protein